jgi:hypothetical protein
MDLSALPVFGDALASAWTLAKEIGKGGGGSTEEPTVCMALLPIALGVGYVGLRRLREVYLRRLEEGRPLRVLKSSSQRKVQTA